MAHHMGWELAGEPPSVRKAPQELLLLAAVGQANDAQIHIGSVLDVLAASLFPVLVSLQSCLSSFLRFMLLIIRCLISGISLYLL